ncbi:protein-tyrosine-phosphatase [Aquimarina sp. ERC-38]|uniref:arsenate-mycothiol transferase ArsC n=1 Tax=Aquimarina sp. ERC-38 TaxID=2949996 RepID=UPI002245DF9A|nr:protein-tyrosine-phosphatase [Aquimarina sp. ERC-38]UZO79467.1 protein-tyrosine-phosphatase [Aquimarina sp. ERC-38]
MKIYPQISTYLEQLKPESISEDRKKLLEPLCEYIKASQKAGDLINLNFICTHNSRRSHLSQIWAQTIATYCGIDKVFSYSGGTEATAVYPMVLTTLKNIGFQIDALNKAENPVHAVKFGEIHLPVVAFSKKYDHSFNPKKKFVAILTCSEANEACPFVPGADQRFPITFEDPKAFDHTDKALEKYEERSRQIAMELLYVFSHIR